MERERHRVSCDEVRELAPLCLSRELDSRLAGLLSEHLEACSSCAREFGEQIALDASLRAGILSDHVDTSVVDRRVREKIAFENRGWEWPRWFAGAAAFTLALVAGMLFLQRSAPIYAAAARDHRWEIVEGQHRKWLTDPALVEALAERRGFSRTMVAGMAPAGYRLVQGKLCRLDGHVFLHLVYANGLANFSVFLRRQERKNEPSTGWIHREKRDLEYVAGFRRGDADGLIVTEQSDNAAWRFAQSAEAVL
jgi:anti-sigma factor RsiW